MHYCLFVIVLLMFYLYIHCVFILINCVCMAMGNSSLTPEYTTTTTVKWRKSVFSNHDWLCNSQ